LGFPREGFQVFSEVAGRRKLLGDQIGPQAAADSLDLRRLGRVPSPPANDVVQDSDQLDDIGPNRGGTTGAPVIKVDEFHVEVDPAALDQHVLIVDVSVILAHPMQLFDSQCEGVQEVKGFKGGQAFTAAARDKFRENLAFNELADQTGHWDSSEAKDF